jgi:hypothetical protein
MSRNAPLAWRFGIASLSLLSAIAVYCFARLYPPALLETFQATNPKLASLTVLFGSAPSFLYTLALGLLVCACATTLNKVRIHCVVWIGLALYLELTQAPIIAGTLPSWLAVVLSELFWDFVGSYWPRGAFDPLDLVATLLGGIIALALLSSLPREGNDAREQ